MTDLLLHALAGLSRAAVQQLERRALETHERGRVDGVGEVAADRSDRRTIADAESHRMDGIVEVPQIALVKANAVVKSLPVSFFPCGMMPPTT